MGKILQKRPVAKLQKALATYQETVPNVHRIQNKVYFFFCLAICHQKLFQFLMSFLNSSTYPIHIFSLKINIQGSLHGNQVVSMALILVIITSKRKGRYSCRRRTEKYCRNQMAFEAKKANHYKNGMIERLAWLGIKQG